MQAPEVSLNQAIAHAPAASARLLALANQHRANHQAVNEHNTMRHWEHGAGTFCYQTHTAIDEQPAQRLNWLTDTFFNASTLPTQPWYPQFLNGEAQAIKSPDAADIVKHQLTIGRFDLGLPKPRHYRQLVSLSCPDDVTRVVCWLAAG